MLLHDTHRDASRRVTVPGEQGKDVVLAVVAGSSNQGQIRGVGASIGIAGSLHSKAGSLSC
jgi:hypothetical protein